MKVIMVMFDSLNRRMLPPYGCGWIHAPNFGRLAERSVTFDNAWVGSMACMPARRELHTGRYNFLHRSWGPLEPFDDSIPQMLKERGIYTHLVTDHQHYFEDGGGTYHTRYSSWEFMRGQEGDPWIGQVADPQIPEDALGVKYFAGETDRPAPMWRQDWVNRAFMNREERQPQANTFAAGMDFIRRNSSQDNWFLHLETFDPHEPFFAQQHYKDLYPHRYDGPHYDWPPYAPVTESEEQVRHLLSEYAALVSMCDHYLGEILNLMDELKLWDDTMLIVNTDHGFLLGEHDWWAKVIQPFYNEVAHMPLFIWDPRSGRRGVHCPSLVQTIDLPATIIELFGIDPPRDMQGLPLREALANDDPVHEAILYGVFGGHVNCTDGRYTYMLAPAGEENEPLFHYTVMASHMRSLFTMEELSQAEIAGPLPFTKGARLMKIPAHRSLFDAPRHDYFGKPLQTMLFDLESDYLQNKPITNPDVEGQMRNHVMRLMEQNDAPAEQYERLGLPRPPVS
jgi:arylsulfatase A-like enzyme